MEEQVPNVQSRVSPPAMNSQVKIYVSDVVGTSGLHSMLLCPVFLL
jgi:hypothetical protein